MTKHKIELVSASRYNGGIAIKRNWGSSTITEFYVTIDGVHQAEKVKGYGRTPGERKTYAKNIVLTKLVKDVQES
jgi:hypothetical protein